MSLVVGIDLGTTNSLVAAVDAGLPFLIPGQDGERLTPSVVHIPAEGPLIVGRPASRWRILRPQETVYSIKRFMGRRIRELSEEEREVSYPLRGSRSSAVTVKIHGRAYTPEQISAEILRKLKADAERYWNEEVTRAVITVPAYFNDAQRNATLNAGELAGLQVERILNEPTAAALAYGLDKLKEHSKIAVYDLGGGTFDLSILELNGGVFQVLATHGNTRLGGDDLDRRIADFLSERIRQAGGPDARQDPAVGSRVREAAEAAKIRLSSEREVEISLPFLSGDFSFQQRLSREELEVLTRDIVERTRTHCLRSLADGRLEPANLDQIILVGGQTRMPLVRRLVAEIFHCSEFDAAVGDVRLGNSYHQRGPALNTSQNPDEAVALGAAIQAEILSGGFKNLLLLDVTPLSLGLETFGGLMNVIIPRNSTIPIKAGEMFTTAVDLQKSMLIHVLQGERDRAEDNWSLGKFTLEFEPAPKGVPRVGVQFEIDANGILHVLARDIRTGREKVVEIKSVVDAADADVQKMVEESVEHAFDDLRVRQWVEAKLRGIETIEATWKGLAECGAEVEPEIRKKIETTLAQLEARVRQEDGNVQELKALHVELDEATQPLADLLMERVMDAALKKRGILGPTE